VLPSRGWLASNGSRHHQRSRLLFADSMTEQTSAAAAAMADPDRLIASLNEQYRARLVLFAARRLRGDRATAEDVVQEALRTTLDALRDGRVRDVDALPGFAYETVRNICMHRGRSAGREATAMERFAKAPPLSREDPLALVISEERRQAVRAAMQQLDDGDRRLLLMTYVDGRTSEDIGRELGITAVAVRVRRHRALERLTVHLRVTETLGREQR